ncbi:hypothetical protein BDZ91DRAFT_778076, partial [Kalaharituber pfeilii]
MDTGLPSMPTSPIADLVAMSIVSAFTALPAKSKPRLRNNGSYEWVTLAGIALEHDDGKITCVSLGTGVKCLPSSKVPLAKGLVLHDCHAEILALRAFNAFLIEECRLLLTASPEVPEAYVSPYVRLREVSELCCEIPHPFAIREGVKIHMFTSEAPCGDCSMELTILSQPDPTPWAPPPPSPESTLPSTSIPSPLPLLRGRGYFSHLGTLRTKPGRPDSPPSLSKSCSDKLSLKTFLSTLSTPTSYLIAPLAPAYISTLILPHTEYSYTGCARAFGVSGRLTALSEDMGTETVTGLYTFRPFISLTTTPALPSLLPPAFPFSRRYATATSATPTPSNISTVAILPHNLHETLISGVLQGRKAFPPTPLGASRISKLRLWEAARIVAGLVLARQMGGQTVAGELMRWVVRRRRYEELKVPADGNSGDGDAGVGERVRRERWRA